jgi:hypothetical protein
MKKYPCLIKHHTMMQSKISNTVIVTLITLLKRYITFIVALTILRKWYKFLALWMVIKNGKHKIVITGRDLHLDITQC